MITHSESIQKIAAALVKIAAAVENPHKNAQNPHFRSSYADLAEIINTTRHVCAEHGVALVQSPGMSDGLCTVETLMVHESGEWIRGEAASPIQKQDPQGVGSAITYLRRYSLAALLGIAQEDDDGNTASQRRSVNGQPHQKPAPKPATGGDEIACPACSGPMWDNRTDDKAAVNGGKRPDLKCKDKECDTAIWLGAVRDNLARDLEGATQADILTDQQRNRVQEAISGYKEHPAALFASLDWLRGKMAEVQT
jgi:hypothetical protein